MHDIGKLDTDGNILNKPDILTSDERDEINRHPENGYKILISIPSLCHIAPLVRAHHENWDGSGYPDRLAGGAIPLIARIIRIMDSYHAMRSERPYHNGSDRRTKNHAESIAELQRCAGAQFDPKLVKYFVDFTRDYAELHSHPEKYFYTPEQT